MEFPVIHKVDNVPIFVLLEFENESGVVAVYVNCTNFYGLQDNPNGQRGTLLSWYYSNSVSFLSSLEFGIIKISELPNWVSDNAHLNKPL